MNRTLPHVALSQHAHDRHGELRRDEAWLDERWHDAATRVLVISGARLRPVDGKVAWVPSADAPPGGLRLLLGERDEVEHFALLVDPTEAPGDREEWVPLRSVVMGLVDDTIEDGPLVMHAIGMAEWHAATTFCPRCGDRLEPRQAGHVLHSPRCGRDQFPRSDPAVIMLVTDGEPGSPEERALLGRSPAWPAGRYSTLAGFVEPGETMEDAVRREVAEETGVEVGEVAYFGSQPWPMPASLMVGFTGRATSTRVDVDGAEIEAAGWFTREDLRTQSEAGTLVLPSGVSISRSLIEDWYGGPLTGQW
ncbi:NAD(+) diphosphatase [Nocardioides aurantiacus]|uniref:NAD(+) diphosphatase n=1 Tax=Nocardioides aurantiacus TaxID=86796 RepID=A0A3N2CXW1_9ACTN|nr:NAD(+) diphosphatase [Nocardioides aurantiacus]ROR92380.1 NAD+ diphosphatase [Nocardioides aurantiacus]